MSNGVVLSPPTLLPTHARLPRDIYTIPYTEFFCNTFYGIFYAFITNLFVIGLSYNSKAIRYFLNIKLFEYQTILLIDIHSHLIILAIIPIIQFLQSNGNYLISNTIIHSF